jgi:hypothetical protein
MVKLLKERRTEFHYNTNYQPPLSDEGKILNPPEPCQLAVITCLHNENGEKGCETHPNPI